MRAKAAGGLGDGLTTTRRMFPRCELAGRSDEPQHSQHGDSGLSTAALEFLCKPARKSYQPAPFDGAEANRTTEVAGARSSLYPVGAAAFAHRPEPIVIVTAPFLVVELA